MAIAMLLFAALAMGIGGAVLLRGLGPSKASPYIEFRRGESVAFQSGNCCCCGMYPDDVWFYQ